MEFEILIANFIYAIFGVIITLIFNININTINCYYFL